MVWNFWNLEVQSYTPPPTRPPFLILSKWFHQLKTKYSNIWVWGIVLENYYWEWEVFQNALRQCSEITSLKMAPEDNRLPCLFVPALPNSWGMLWDNRDCEVCVVFDMCGDEQITHLHLAFKQSLTLNSFFQVINWLDIEPVLDLCHVSLRCPTQDPSLTSASEKIECGCSSLSWDFNLSF